MPPPEARADEPFPKPPENTARAAQIEHGEIKFTEQCNRCHVFGPSITPDLRKLLPEVHVQFKNIVLKGDFAPFDMERFDDILTEADVEAIQAYLIDQARQGYKRIGESQDAVVRREPAHDRSGFPRRPY